MNRLRVSTLTNFILFQTCWFATVWGAANDYRWLGPLLVTITVPLQLYLFTEHHKAETLFVLTCGITGFTLESILILGRVYLPVEQIALPLCPPWMVGLWFNLAMLISLSLGWLKGKHLLAALLGAIAGPLAYWGGDQLHALKVAPFFWQGYFPLALTWALTLPLLLHTHHRMTLKQEDILNKNVHP